MKRVLSALLLALPIVLHPAFAATEQQSKMTTCNKEAADKKGDERKAFMKECLSSKPKVSAAQKAQQDKMKSCNADAKGMKGDERKKFMSECLKKS
ncbi:MAG TPA: PsiF family protein [Noviherbaspirillum sp.]|nr:PsiF family protein [Noviherbaspirillum sp.]